MACIWFCVLQALVSGGATPGATQSTTQQVAEQPVQPASSGGNHGNSSSAAGPQRSRLHGQAAAAASSSQPSESVALRHVETSRLHGQAAAASATPSPTESVTLRHVETSRPQSPTGMRLEVVRLRPVGSRPGTPTAEETATATLAGLAGTKDWRAIPDEAIDKLFTQQAAGTQQGGGGSSGGSGGGGVDLAGIVFISLKWPNVRRLHSYEACKRFLVDNDHV